mmetsp:Transcript_13776/g.33363  ORF Transcript_13776/g.33363 Transcript_13776/m.33363 type:complete len:218 (-) Transcript_13776:31-684(-)
MHSNGRLFHKLGMLPTCCSLRLWAHEPIDNILGYRAIAKPVSLATFLILRASESVEGVDKIIKVFLCHQEAIIAFLNNDCALFIVNHDFIFLGNNVSLAEPQLFVLIALAFLVLAETVATDPSCFLGFLCQSLLNQSSVLIVTGGNRRARGCVRRGGVDFQCSAFQVIGRCRNTRHSTHFDRFLVYCYSGGLSCLGNNSTAPESFEKGCLGCNLEVF